MKIQTNKTITININKGNLIKLIKKSDSNFKGFGELYLTKIKQSKIKAWKKHNKMFSNLYLIYGKVEFIISTDIYKKKIFFKKYILSEKGKNHILIPPKHVFGFRGLGKNPSMLLNFSNIIHNDNEVTNYPINFFDYKWNKDII